MHPLVRDLYKRAIMVGRDYPHPRGIEFVRDAWKKALRDAQNYHPQAYSADPRGAEKELRKAVGRGRYAIREMIGVIQLKKYRTMRRRYGAGQLDVDGESKRILDACRDLIHEGN
mmetsp:Transcript_4369/g.6671  ORF Transcript_4369/g.6671 Transcript_4369/m.6671 type:complete len:115 (-) Transcript_4369:408-752(-)|eukprot:CAMPEP_0197252228 /NCGR_PEP_ID=MMETSP1429-20130617/60497_1 /TAXON_ID=49237 /ORGANISM="Chaetoceros  sp., Strain UNC1202" /LENGTH=114 /DNA_ID=CAMNT_0042714545 /DNA_START=44 /DNA_END=388 /DNA_ORIENTATION=-